MLTTLNRNVNIRLLVGNAAFLLLISPLVCEDSVTAFPISRRTRAFLLGSDMPKGVYDHTQRRKNRTCSIEGCNEKHFSKGLCRKHYYQENKECITIQQKQYYQDNKEHALERTKKYREEHKEQIKQYRQDNKEQSAKRNKQYYQDNKEYRLEQNKQYNQNNKEHLAKLMKIWRKENRERIFKYREQYYQDNKEQMKLWAQTPIGKASRKAARNRWRTSTKDLTKEIVQRVYDDNIKKFGVLTCCLCFKPIMNNDDSLEHLTPVSRQDEFLNIDINSYDNLGISHLKCNMRKHTMTLKEWEKFKKDLETKSDKEKICRNLKRKNRINQPTCK